MARSPSCAPATPSMCPNHPCRKDHAVRRRALAILSFVSMLVVILPARASAQVSIEPFAELSADGRYDNYIPGGGEGFVARLAPQVGGRVHSKRLVLRLDAIGAYDRYEATVRPVDSSWNLHTLLLADY